MVRTFLVMLILLAANESYAAADYLTYLSSNPPWKDYVPDNYEIAKKKGSAAFFWSNEAEPEKIPDNKLLAKEPFLLLKPNSTIETERKTISGVQIYKARYTTDAFSRRLIENKITEGDKKRNLLFLGCSFTFGTGLADDETFSYYFSKYRPNFNVYNFGIDGAGANDILDDLRSFKRFTDISKNGGFVVYTAIYDQVERSICTVNCYTKSYRDWVLRKSNYQYDAENQVLVNRGSFENSRPVTSMIFGLLTKIGLVDSVTIPYKITDEQLELYVMMVAEMKKTAKEKFNAEFYYTMYPGSYEGWDRIKPLLKKYGIKYLDMSNLDFAAATGNRHKIVLDGHPTKLSNYLFASMLHHQLPK